jgi:hypothetical protein
MLICGITVLAQKTSTVHIVTKRNSLPSPLKYNFEMNGKTYKMKDGECMDVQINADSLHIFMKDRRVIKQQTVDLHIPAEEHIYVWVLLSFEGIFKNGRFVAQTVCKTCFEEIQAGCR